ncbi:outer membrane lipoprotein-sorting protein [Pseudoduganella namucuonensis]|uniref:Outer membrane lipoprotein-sorting protein n=1 Tax=Pseudoduganella namucuonensis TaxID=1035707 RepID=A0A1I7LBU1_9BURK|nr:outer membrane lipoprotein-sorting protein [Pseudoduganella namucuonensis]SFV07150.1 outer membrane lipoprotein-sorting protein [Pseudoduganella namucuonensis]
MFKKIMLAALLAAAGHAGAADVETILKKADAFRLPDASAQVETLVRTFKGGKPDKEKRYQVLVKPGGKSLVLSRSAGEAGLKVLMSGDDFWLLVPGSARAMRITPMQKLLGEASTGDIANMTWAGDYKGSVVREVEVDGVQCLELELAALRKSLSYQRVLLHVAKSDYRPVHADLFAASDRKVKQAHFVVETRDGRNSVTRMTLVDEIQTGRETQVHMVSNKPRQFGDELFNPMYLSRNDVAQ